MRVVEAQAPRREGFDDVGKMPVLPLARQDLVADDEDA
jgi:hypothetical protein